MNLGLLALITSATVAFSTMLVTVSNQMNVFHRTADQLTDAQTSLMASASVVADESNKFLRAVSDSLKDSIRTARNECVRTQRIENNDDTVTTKCVEFRLVVDPATITSRVNAVKNFGNNLASFDTEPHRIKKTLNFGFLGGREADEVDSIHRGLELSLLSSSQVAIQGDTSNSFGSSFRFTTDKLASTLLKETNTSIKKNDINPANFAGLFLSGNNLRISHRLLRSLLTDSEYDFTVENLPEMAVNVFNANDSSNNGLDFTEIPSGLKAVMTVATSTEEKKIIDPETGEEKVKEEEKLQTLTLLSTAQIRTFNSNTAEGPTGDPEETTTCLDGSEPINGECPGGGEDCPPGTGLLNGVCTCEAQGTCGNCIELGTCPPCQQLGTCCPDGRPFPPSGECDVVPESEASNFNLESFNPDLFDLVYNPNEPISADNPACIVHSNKKPKNKSYTCYYVDENGDLIVEQGKGFKFKDGQEVADPNTSVNVGVVGDPDATTITDVTHEGLPRSQQRIGKLDAGFESKNGNVTFPPGVVAVKKKNPRTGKTEFQFFDPVTGELIAILPKAQVPKSIRKEINDSISDFADNGGVNTNDLFEGDAADSFAAFNNQEDFRGDLTNGNIATKKKKWHRKNRRNKGVKLGESTIRVNGVEYDTSDPDDPVSKLADAMQTATQDFARERNKQLQDKKDKKGAKAEYNKAKKKVKGINSNIKDLEDKMKGASKKKKDKLRAKIADLENQKDDAKGIRTLKENDYNTAKGTFQETKAAKKTAKKEIKSSRKAIKTHFKKKPTRTVRPGKAPTSKGKKGKKRR